MNFSRGRLVALMAILFLLLAACGSGTSDTTSADSPTTTEPEAVTTTEETSDPGSVGSFSDIPAACLDAFRGYLQEIEPFVEDFDAESATMAEFEALAEQFEDATLQYEDDIADCPELDLETEEAFAAMIDFAQSEAPGTVAYFEFLQQFIGSVDSGDGGTSASGNCDTDIAAIEEFVERGGTASDLTVAESLELTTLIASVSTACPADQVADFFAREDVAAFMESSG